MRNNKILDKEVYKKGIENLPKVLDSMGYADLRPGQDSAVHTILSGRDLICFMPTSFGKSAIYQIPTACQGWRTLVFSPLLSLIQDQLEKLQNLGMKAGQVSSNQTPGENNLTMSDWEYGELNYLFAAPEKLANDGFLRVMSNRKPDMVVVDEAHCISSWGMSFRTSYQDIGLFIELYRPKVVLAMTATKTKEVEKDIRKHLGTEGAALVSYFPPRDNLSYQSAAFSIPTMLRTINKIEGPTIVYSSSVRETEDLYNSLASNVSGGATIYHGELNSAERTANQSTFMHDRARVMFATKAFGMGIDKPDIRGIIHKGFCSSLEDYAQETGRAGRDGKDSMCYFLYDDKAIGTQQWFIENQYPSRSAFSLVFNYINKRKDKHGYAKILVSEISKSHDIHNASIQSCLNIMAQHKVVERKKTSSKLCKIKLLKEHIDEKITKILCGVSDFGVMQEDGFYEVDLEALASVAGIKPATLRNKLKALDVDGYLIFIPPFRGTPTKVIGTLDLIDFKQLQYKASLEMSKLRHVKEFIDTDDEHKSEFIYKYFK